MTRIPDDLENNKEGLEWTARRWGAAVGGAVEGFVDAMERYPPAPPAAEAFREANELRRAVTEASREQARSPEMQQMGAAMRRAGHATNARAADVRERVTGRAHAGADAARERAHAVQEGTHSAAEAVRERAHAAQERVGEMRHNLRDGVVEGREALRMRAHDTAEMTRQTVERVREGTRVRYDAVVETGSRAKQAPAKIGREMKQGLGAWMKGIGRSAGLATAAGVVGLTAFIVFTVGLVVLLNALLGDPWGTLLVAVLYVVLAGAALWAARNALAEGQTARQRAMANSKEEMANVVRPVRTAFTRKGRAY